MASVLRTISEIAGVGELVFRLESGTAIDADAPSVTLLIGTVLSLHRIVELSEFRFRPKPSGPPTSYLYSFTALDGREWEQEFRFTGPDPLDPEMDFSTGFWRLSEFRLHRPIRDQIVQMRDSVGLSDMRVTFTPA